VVDAPVTHTKDGTLRIRVLPEAEVEQALKGDTWAV